MKKVAILGASGSIGTSTLEVIRRHKDKFTLVAFSVNTKIELIRKILDEFKEVEVVAVRSLQEIEDIINDYKNVRFYEKEEGLIKVATSSATVVVSALVGFVGLIPTIKAIENGKDIALANKETLVAAGNIVMKKASENNVKILPVDSEHSAIFQCLEGNNKPKRIILTASGGPFFKYNESELEKVTLEDALCHPTWKMGAKITIDSATMFNKAFEIIEASHLFNLKGNQIDVLIHPQSIVHSLVEFEDGAMKAQLGVSDMKVPIAYALNYGTRLDNIANHLDLASSHDLEFYEASPDRFKPLALAYEALRIGGSYPVILNAANEEAVRLFLDKKIRFVDIYRLVKKVLDSYDKYKQDLTIDDILKIDKEARKKVLEVL